MTTPLHWAAFVSAELSLNYIQAFGGEINAQDVKGLTPLHLAVRNCLEAKHSRIIKALLIKGANKDI